jgi:PAS domain S-box-containing protein
MTDKSETPMWMVDAGTYRITTANHSAEKLFGYTADQLASKTIFDVVVPEQADALREAFAARAFAGHGGTWTLRHPSGATFRIRIRYHYVQRDGAKLQFTFADEIHGHPDFPEGKTKGVAR